VTGESVAAVAITFQRRDLLRQTLQSLLAQERPFDEIIVVDNASSDGTAAMLEAEFPAVTHLRMDQNLGPAGALYVGLGHAHARGHHWAWTTGDDYVAKPETLRVLLATAQRISDDRLGILGCWFVPTPNHVIHTGALWRHRPVDQPKPPVGSPAYQSDIMSFKGTLIALDMVPEIGLPRDQYFLMNEEYEYCLRAIRGGRRNYILPVPLLQSLENGSPVRYPPWRGYYQTRNHLAMALDHRSPPELLWWAIMQAKYIAAAALTGRGSWERIRLRLRGAWHGFRGVSGRTLDPALWGARPAISSSGEPGS